MGVSRNFTVLNSRFSWNGFIFRCFFTTKSSSWLNKITSKSTPKNLKPAMHQQISSQKILKSIKMTYLEYRSGSWILDHGSWIQDAWSRIRDPWSRILDHGSWIVDHWSCNLHPGSCILDPWSWILHSGSSILDLWSLDWLVLAGFAVPGCADFAFFVHLESPFIYIYTLCSFHIFSYTLHIPFV